MERQADLEQKRDGGLKALAIMELQLARQDYIAGDRYSIADIALFAYTHVAHEGGFMLDEFPGIRAWIDRIKDRPQFVPMATKD